LGRVRHNWTETDKGKNIFTKKINWHKDRQEYFININVIKKTERIGKDKEEIDRPKNR
jgi:hypothetical protein